MVNYKSGDNVIITDSKNFYFGREAVVDDLASDLGDFQIYKCVLADNRNITLFASSFGLKLAN